MTNIYNYLEMMNHYEIIKWVNAMKSFNNVFYVPLQNVQVKIIKVSSEEYTPANPNSTYNQNYIKNYIKITTSQTLFFFRNGNNYYVIDYKAEVY